MKSGNTNIFVYLFENYGNLSEQGAALRSKMLVRGDRLLTSALTLGEILVKPTEQHNGELCRKYEKAILATSLVLPLQQGGAKLRRPALRPLSARSRCNSACLRFGRQRGPVCHQ